MRLLSLTLGLLFFTSTSFADMITLVNGKTEKEGVNISVGAEVQSGGSTFALTTVGSGVRRKKVVIVPIKVYVAQVLVAEPDQFVKSQNEVLGSFDHISAAAMHLTFLRDVPAEKIKESFLSGLEANKIPTNTADVLAFIQAVENLGAAEEGSTMTLFVSKDADGQETLSLENKGSETKSQSVRVTAGLMTKIMAIWLGVPSDSYLGELKAEILQN